MFETLEQAMDPTRVSLLVRLKESPSEVDWTAFYQTYAGVILAYAAKRGLAGHEGEDVLQDTMIDLMRALPEFTYRPDKGLFRNFLLTIVHRKVMRALRRKYNRHEISMDEPLHEEGHSRHDELAAPTPQHGEEEEQDWKQAVLREAWARVRQDPSIQPTTLQVFEAYVLNQQPAAEVAARFELKDNAVYQIRNRLIKRLQDEIQLLAPEVT